MIGRRVPNPTDARIEQLTAQVAALTAQVATLTAERDQLAAIVDNGLRTRRHVDALLDARLTLRPPRP